MHAGESRAQVHRRCKPHRSCAYIARTECGHSGRGQNGKVLAAEVAREPGSPAIGQRGVSAETCDALKARQRKAPGSTLVGQIQVRDHDDELAHERVF